MTSSWQCRLFIVPIEPREVVHVVMNCSDRQGFGDFAVDSRGVRYERLEYDAQQDTRFRIGITVLDHLIELKLFP